MLSWGTQLIPAAAGRVVADRVTPADKTNDIIN